MDEQKQLEAVTLAFTLNGKIAFLTKEIDEMAARVGVLKNEMVNRTTNITAKKSQIEKAKAELDELEKKLEITKADHGNVSRALLDRQAEYKTAQANLKDTLNNLEKSGIILGTITEGQSASKVRL